MPQNEEAEELMRKVEKEEERSAMQVGERSAGHGRGALGCLFCYADGVVRGRLREERGKQQKEERQGAAPAPCGPCRCGGPACSHRTGSEKARALRVDLSWRAAPAHVCTRCCALQDPDKPCFHLCIINLVIGTLYCAKGNYEFGVSRIIKSLEPYDKKLETDTWCEGLWSSTLGLGHVPCYHTRAHIAELRL